MEIKNLIFDMGNVLIRFEPEVFLVREGVTDEKNTEALQNAIFRSVNWPRLDTGEWNEADLLKAAKAQLPEELHNVAERLIFHWDEPIRPMEGMEELLKKCRKAGYKLYLLSNASRRQHEYWKRVPGNELFEATVISADEGIIKPGHDIFKLILERYDLKPEESLFIDDMPANIEAAGKVGIHTFRFSWDAKELEDYIFGNNFMEF